MAQMDYYRKLADVVLKELNTDFNIGLSDKEATQRIRDYGPNRLETGEVVSPWKILLHNINNIIVYLLLAASILSFIMNDPIEGLAIGVAVLIAILFGFFVELKAQHTVESLQSMIQSKAKVRREGRLIEIDASALVPGDIVFLEEGDAIPADGRLVQSQNFACIESALTGESEAVEKDHHAFYGEEVALGDRANYVYAGTTATRGNAYAVVTVTGMHTEVGKISSLLKETKKEQTPLNKELSKLGKLVILFAAACAILITIIGLATGYDLPFIMHIALILAIAAIPEAMPAVSTITLSRGMNKMARYKALVKSLPAVETLGSTSVICTDKTGTLTENQMTVEKIALVSGAVFDVTGNGYQPTGEIFANGKPVELADHDMLEEFVIAGALCSNATLVEDESGEYAIIGDPTEGALVVLATKINRPRDALSAAGWERIGEIPFNSERKFMVTAYRRHTVVHAFIKGAPDVLLEMALHDQPERESLDQLNNEFASEGLRVLAVGKLTGYDGDGSEESLKSKLDSVCLLGLAGIIDPPRYDVKEAINTCQSAGIQVKMITGDHPKTAAIIAASIGLAHNESVMTGQQLDQLAEEEDEDAGDDRIVETAVFARVSPENKLQIIQALKRQDRIVAMTGDGVNDAPALSGADIGIAMGIRGSEVAKEAADMVLTDDRFSTIIDAIREGRVIFANIRKYVYFLFTCNMVEILTIIFSLVFLYPMPILPLHVLFLNLVVDISPAIAIGFDSAESNVMKQPPRRTQEGLINRKFLFRILLSGFTIAVFSFAVFIVVLKRSGSVPLAQTATFTMMAVAQLLHTFNVRSENDSGFGRSLLKNKMLIGALLFSLSLQLLAVYTPFLNSVLQTVPLAGVEWFIIGAAAILSAAFIYLIKKTVR